MWIFWENLKHYLTFLMRIDWSLRAKSIDLILRSRFFLARTFFSEFLMWWVWVPLISLSIPLDCIFFCKIVNALSRSLENTFTLIPRSCCNWWFRVMNPVTRFAIVFIFFQKCSSHFYFVFCKFRLQNRQCWESRLDWREIVIGIWIRLTGRNLAGEIKELVWLMIENVV